jgi:hypothetical protein
MARELIVVVALAACGGSQPAPATPSNTTSPSTTALAPGELARSDVSRVELQAPPSCAEGSCTARLVVHALGEFKVNAEYPTKFVAAADSAALAGPGSFEPGDTTGVLTLEVTPQGGATRVHGVFKYSVCTEDVCKIEEPSIAFDVR